VLGVDMVMVISDMRGDGKMGKEHITIYRNHSAV
jgi:hypothetical protein